MQSIDYVVDLRIGQIEIERQTNVIGDNIVSLGKPVAPLGYNCLGVAGEERLRVARTIIKVTRKRDSVVLLQTTLQHITLERGFQVNYILVIGRLNTSRDLE